MHAACGSRHARGGAALQIGDGAIVTGPKATGTTAPGWKWLFWPQKGEYANSTLFLTDETALAKAEVAPLTVDVQDVAVFSDGLEALALHFGSRTAHEPFFRAMFPPLHAHTAQGEATELSGQIAQFLTSPAVRAHGRRHLSDPRYPTRSSVMTLALRRASNRAAVSLGEMLGQGGEGAVYPLTDTPDLVAKIYHEPPHPSKVEKLAAMTRTAVPAVLRVAAWPVDLLIDEADTVRGFLMPKVDAREDAHELYSPKSRRESFPRADFRFVVRAGANLARAVATMHLQGHVIGDINHGNALIGRDCTVVLIDCDSFQIRGEGQSFTCDVGVPLFTPPELHGMTFRGLQRSTHHDGFGLAVLLFHLLFAGRHPLAGRYAGGEMTIERAIAESRFAYGARAASLGMSRPPATLSLNAFGPQIAELFERAFAKPAPDAPERPAATEWVAALRASGGRTATMRHRALALSSAERGVLLVWRSKRSSACRSSARRTSASWCQHRTCRASGKPSRPSLAHWKKNLSRWSSRNRNRPLPRRRLPRIATRKNHAAFIFRPLAGC